MTDLSRNGNGSNHRAADILISLSLGLLAGAGAALLLAPASGRNTRRRIREMAGQVAYKTGRVANHAGDVVHGPVNRVEEAAADGKQAMANVRVNRTR